MERRVDTAVLVVWLAVWVTAVLVVTVVLVVLVLVVRTRSRLVLLATTFGISFYPILTGMTHSYYPIPIYAGMAGIFQAGLNLVFFDELMKTFPAEYSATFVAAAQSLQYLSSILAPFLGTYLADQIGISNAFYISGAVSLVGFALFAMEKKRA